MIAVIDFLTQQRHAAKCGNSRTLFPTINHPADMVIRNMRASVAANSLQISFEPILEYAIIPPHIGCAINSWGMLT